MEKLITALSQFALVHTVQLWKKSENEDILFISPKEDRITTPLLSTLPGMVKTAYGEVLKNGWQGVPPLGVRPVAAAHVPQNTVALKWTHVGKIMELYLLDRRTHVNEIEEEIRWHKEYTIIPLEALVEQSSEAQNDALPMNLPERRVVAGIKLPDGQVYPYSYNSLLDTFHLSTDIVWNGSCWTRHQK